MYHFLRLPHSQIAPSNGMLDIQIYNSKLKENSLLCMLNHQRDREQYGSQISAAQCNVLHY